MTTDKPAVKEGTMRDSRVVANRAPRPMTGFLATLTAEQRERVLAYRGPENFGDKSMAKAKT